MKSTPGSDRASPLQGHVKFVPSMRNVFSLVPEPNAETLLVETLPGDVGRNARRGPDEVEHAESANRDGFEILGPEAGLESALARFDPRAGALDDQRLLDARQLEERAVLSIVAPTPMRMSSS